MAFANAYTLHGGGIGELGRDLLTAVLDREPARPAPWRPGATPPGDTETLTGRWWWMGEEFEASWDGRTHELVIQPLSTPAAAWRFTPDGMDRWRCRSGTNNGEVLRVRRTRAGSVSALDIATAVFTREPWPAL